MKKTISLDSLQRLIIEPLKKLIDKKVDMVNGKTLSTNDYTTSEKEKLSGIAVGAEVNVQSDWNVIDNTSDAYIKNKPRHITYAEIDAIFSQEFDSATAIVDSTTGVAYRLYVNNKKLCLEETNDNSSTESTSKFIVFIDMTTDEIYKVYVNNGKLIMEVANDLDLEASVNFAVYVDETTDDVCKVYINNEELTMMEVE